MSETLNILPFALMPGPQELWVILLIALLLFGGTRIPKLMRSLGQGITEFKKGVKGDIGPEETEETAEIDAKNEPVDKEGAPAS